MARYSEQDLKYAAEFRDGVHREALAIVRRTRPDASEVVDRHPVEDYFQQHWDYPGKWFDVVAVPYGYASRRALVDAIVSDTLSGYAPAAAEPGRRRLTDRLEGKPDGFKELFTVDVDQEHRSCRTVGTDAAGRYILEHYEEYNIGGAVGSAGEYYVLSDAEFRRYARLALINGNIPQERYDAVAAGPARREDPFYALLADYPGLAVEYRIVEPDAPYAGLRSHRDALKAAWRTLRDGDGEPGDPDLAEGTQIAADELFSSHYREGKLNYRRAFLYPPHGSGCTWKDFVRVNAALFPEGTNGLEVYEWTTDWSEYFDDGREWWGTLCLTVYDKSLGRFVVITASATD